MRRPVAAFKTRWCKAGSTMIRRSEGAVRSRITGRSGDHRRHTGGKCRPRPGSYIDVPQDRAEEVAPDDDPPNDPDMHFSADTQVRWVKLACTAPENFGLAKTRRPTGAGGNRAEPAGSCKQDHPQPTNTDNRITRLPKPALPDVRSSGPDRMAKSKLPSNITLSRRGL